MLQFPCLFAIGYKKRQFLLKKDGPATDDLTSHSTGWDVLGPCAPILPSYSEESYLCKDECPMGRYVDRARSQELASSVTWGVNPQGSPDPTEMATWPLFHYSQGTPPKQLLAQGLSQLRLLDFFLPPFQQGVLGLGGSTLLGSIWGPSQRSASFDSV